MDYLQRHPDSLIRGKGPDLPFGDVPKTSSTALPAPALSTAPQPALPESAK